MTPQTSRPGRGRPAHGSGPVRAGLPRRHRNRLVGVLAVFGVAFSLITYKLVTIQGSGSTSLNRVENGYVSKIPLPDVRGAILAANGDDLAYTQLLRLIAVDPPEVSGAARLDRRTVIDQQVYEAVILSPLLHVPASGIESDMQERTTYVALAPPVSEAVSDKIMGLGLPGIRSDPDAVRVHPDGGLASEILGGVNDSGGDAGLEYEYNAVLRGAPGQLVESVDANKQPIPGSVTEDKPAINGDDVLTTLDEALQYQTEQALSRAVAAAKAKGGTALVMDTRTGALLAVASVVNTPDGPVTAPSAEAFTNVYEPGSVAKIITLSGALTDHVIGPFTKFTIPEAGYLAGGTTFHDAETNETEVLSPTGILAQSSNIGAIQVGQRLGAARLYGFEAAYGLTRETGVHFPGESSGVLLPLSQISGTTLPTMAFGEANAVTAAQMIAAVNTVADGGVYVAPRLVTATVNASGREQATTTPAPHRVIPRPVAETVTRMLEQVVSSGTGTAAAIGGYDVAGKTGTSILVNHGLQVPGHYVSSFAGFAPARDPAITAMVVVDDTHEYAAQASAGAFSTIMRDALLDLGIPSSGAQPAPELAAVPIVDGHRETALLGL